MVKWNWKSFVTGVVSGSLLFSGITYAAPNIVKLVVDGKFIQSEVPAQIIDGSTLVPARALAEALGANVQWDPENQTVVIATDSYSQQYPGVKVSFGEQSAEKLAKAATEHVATVLAGGKEHGQGAVETFALPGQELPYRWMGSDLDTKAKYIAYLEEVFTSEQAEAYWFDLTANASIVEIDGKLAQPNADGGSSLNWGEAKATAIEDAGDEKTYRFKLTDGSGAAVEKELHVRFIEGKGWKLNVEVGTF